MAELSRELQPDAYSRPTSERHAQEVEHKITPKWVGGLVRRRLGLHTVRRAGAYVIPASEGPRLEQLYEKYGIATEPESPPPPDDLPF